ncbi:MAG: helix-turn-helix domain-containing protein [Hyphomicrobiaceae bacterium]|nr:helix-turn-helix domain-containing protein [Hyphomicrobiaceae bacterium]
MLLEVPEVCALLSISRSTLWKISKSGALPSVKIGRGVRFRADDVLAFVRNLGEAA